MTPEQAAHQINEMVFRPGWRFAAARYDATTVGVVAEVESYDTSYRRGDGTLYKPMTLHPSALIDVSELDRDGLFCAIITQLVRPFDDHEDREFLASRSGSGQWRAPLHPHTTEGDAAWAKGAEDRALRVLSELVSSFEPARR